MGKNIGKNISENLSRKYSQKLLDHTKQSATDVFKTASKRVIHEKKQKQLVISFAKASQKIFQRQLQMRTIRKYLKKDFLTS